MSQLVIQRATLAALESSISVMEASVLTMKMMAETMKASIEIMEAEAAAQTAEAQPAEGPVQLLIPPVDAPAPVAAEPVKKNKRNFAKLPEALELGTTVRIVSGGDKWVGTFTKDGFKVGENFYKSPFAFTAAHAQRITEKHPVPTKPGNGWEWVVVESGPHAGKTIGEVYDTRFD